MHKVHRELQSYSHAIPRKGGGVLVRLRTGIGMNFSVCGGDYLSHCRARNASDLVRGNVLHRLCCTDFR